MQGLPAAQAKTISQLPPTAAIFATFLGYNPLKTIIPAQILANLTTQQVQKITSPTFFPSLVSVPFMNGLQVVLWLAAAMSLIAAIVSAMRNKKDLYIAQRPAEKK